MVQPEREHLLTQQFEWKGKWNSHFFKNNNPIVLELGCGKGEYTLHLAQRNPEKNYIGIDIKGARFWRGAKTATEENVKNAAFLRTQIELIHHCFSKNEVDEIWITFPDPQIKFKRSKHRLTHPDFLANYKNILKTEGKIHLKTDSLFLFGYTLGILAHYGTIIYAHHDIYNNPHSPEDAIAVQTFYEKMFLENKHPITYLQFTL